jgi:alpha-amylase
MEVGTRHAGKTFIDWLGLRTEKVSIDKDGKGDFTVGAASVSVWIPTPS